MLRSYVEDGHNIDLEEDEYSTLKNAMISLLNQDDIKTRNESICEHLVNLSFFGNRNTSLVSQSIIASSLPRIRCEKLLNDSYECLEAESQDEISPIRRRMGKVKFASLRKTYNIIKNGGEIPKHNYTFRIDGHKVSHAIAFLQESLQMKPGCTCNIWVSGHLFKDMCVYERGGRSGDNLVDAYTNAVPSDERVGRQTFRDMIKLLTKRGETKEGLSTYYILFRYSSNTFVLMMKRLDELGCFFRNQSELQGCVQKLVEEWKCIEQFLSWEYSSNHLSFDSADISHCCRCALGGICARLHGDTSCIQCSNMVSFFDTSVKKTIQLALDNLLEPIHRDEINTMHGDIVKLSDMLRHYMSHRLRAKVQFSAINKVKQWIKEDNKSRILVVMDHKQKVLSMKYREGQVEYYGKKGMSLLGSMIIECVIDDDDDVAFRYTFVDYVIKGYSGQDNVQVAAVLNLMVSGITRNNPTIKEICLQSDNATCFASQDMMPYIYHLNDELSGIKFVKWIFTEAQTGRGRLDTHFSYINIMLRSYVEDGHNIDLEEDIVKALSYRGGLAGTTVVLVDASDLTGKTLHKSFHCNGIGSRETHEIVWKGDIINVFASSNVTAPISVHKTHLEKFIKNELCATVEFEFTSSKSPLVLSVKSSHNRTQNSASISSKAQTYVRALTNAGIGDNEFQNVVIATEVDTPQFYSKPWAVYPGNTTEKLCEEVLAKLRFLYDIGNVDKKRKISADRALRILIDELIYDDWEQRVIISVPRIKAFFALTPSKQKDVLENTSPNKDIDQYKQLVQNIEEEEINMECIDNADSLQDLDTISYEEE